MYISQSRRLECLVGAPYELFRALSGLRRLEELRLLDDAHEMEGFASGMLPLSQYLGDISGMPLAAMLDQRQRSGALKGWKDVARHFLGSIRSLEIK